MWVPHSSVCSCDLIDGDCSSAESLQCVFSPPHARTHSTSSASRCVFFPNLLPGGWGLPGSSAPCQGLRQSQESKGSQRGVVLQLTWLIPTPNPPLFWSWAVGADLESPLPVRLCSIRRALREILQSCKHQESKPCLLPSSSSMLTAAHHSARASTWS